MSAAVNPVLRRELRERMRATRTAVVVTGYLATLVLIFVLVERSLAGGPAVNDPTELARLGRTVFDWVLAALLLLVVLLVPALAAGAVAGERERQTLVPLQVTPLSARRIVVGKVLSSLSLLGLLVVLALPVLVLTWVLGGASVGQVAAALAVVVVAGTTLACATVACSAATRRTQTAALASATLTLVVVAGTLGAYQLLDPGVVGDDESPPAVLLAANPLAVVAAATAPPPGTAAARADSPLRPIRAAVSPLRDGETVTCPTEATRADVPEGCPEPEAPAAPVPLGGAVLEGPGGIVVAPDGMPVQDEGAAAEDAEVVVQGGYGPFLALALGLAVAVSVLSVAFAAWRLRIPAEVER